MERSNSHDTQGTDAILLAAQRLRAVTLDLCWGQWTAAGVAGVRATHHSIIDPEALIVLSVGFTDEDPRLLGQLIDWLVVNPDVVDLARIRRLARSESPARRVRLTELAQSLGDVAPRLRSGWSSIAREEGGRREPQSMAADSTARWGAQSPHDLRSLSQGPQAWTASGTRFRARSLVGVGARAETLVYLWTHDWVHGRLVAERAVYNQAPVAGYLAELAAARLVERRPKGNRVLYRAAPSLLELGQPTAQYVDWVAAYRGIALVLDAAPESGGADVAGIAVARALGDAAEDLAAEGFDFHVPDLKGWARDGDERVGGLIDALADRVASFAP